MRSREIQQALKKHLGTRVDIAQAAPFPEPKKLCGTLTQVTEDAIELDGDMRVPYFSTKTAITQIHAGKHLLYDVPQARPHNAMVSAPGFMLYD